MRLQTALSLSFAILVLPACDNGGDRCVPGLVIECPCGGGLTGTQRCQSDGTFSACDCATDGGMADGGMPDGGAPEDAPVAADAGNDAAPDAGERIYYGGKIDGAGPAWATLPGAGGLIGLEAGNAACQTIGADHVCDYEEVIVAAALGQLSEIPAGTTAWVQRTTTALVGGVPSAPGPGADCVGWTYATNHIGDGEYMVFETAGVPTFHLDNDTYYDGIDTTHQIPGDLQCGGMVRSILCCYPAP